MTEQCPPAVERLRLALADLARLDRASARTMPPEFYTSEDFLEFEKENLFRREWVCLGHTDEIPGPGDYYTTDLVEESLIVVRGASGEIEVLSNVCRHRGNIVVEGRGKARSFVCQYHAWTYDLDGRLKTAPLMTGVEGFERNSCRLPRFATEIWNNFIFVNLDGNAPPLSPQLASAQEILRNYHHEMRHLLFSEDAVWNTNWKNLDENFMEGYHLSSTHLATLHAITPTRLCRKIPGESAFTGYRAYYDPSIPERGPFHSDLTADEKRNTVLLNIFPAFVVAVATHYTLYLCLRPDNVGRVAIRWGVCGFQSDPEDPAVLSYVELCRAFNAEDQDKLESLQRAQRTRYLTSGPLAPDDYEGTIWDFLNYMSRKLGADVGSSTPSPRTGARRTPDHGFGRDSTLA